MDEEMTIRIDPARFPKEFWSSHAEPFYAVDERLLDDVQTWVTRLIPHQPCIVELGGYAPAPVVARIVKTLCDVGYVDKFYMHKPRSPVCRVW